MGPRASRWTKGQDLTELLPSSAGHSAPGTHSAGASRIRSPQTSQSPADILCVPWAHSPPLGCRKAPLRFPQCCGTRPVSPTGTLLFLRPRTMPPVVSRPSPPRLGCF